MAASEEASFSTIEKWRAKSFELSHQSRDVIVQVMLKGLDAMAATVCTEAPDNLQIERLLRSLDSERRLSMDYDDCSDPIRELTYGFIESLWVTLTKVNEQRRGGGGERRAGGMDVMESLSLNMFGMPATQSSQMTPEQPLFEPIDQSVVKQEQLDYLAYEEPILQDEQPLSVTSHAALSFADAALTDPHIEMDGMEMDEEDEAPALFEAMMRVPDGEMEEEEEEMKIASLRPQRKSVQAINYAEEKEEEEEEEEEEMDGAKKKKKEKRSCKWTVRPAVCPLCSPDKPFNSTVWPTFKQHLWRIHHTNMTKAGFSFECDCGVRSMTGHHRFFENCSGVNVRVVATTSELTTNEKIRVAGATSLPCPVCQKQFKSTYSLIYHLKYTHSKTLAELGVYFRCKCGFVSRSSDHSTRCPMSQQSLVRDEDEPFKPFRRRVSSMELKSGAEEKETPAT